MGLSCCKHKLVDEGLNYENTPDFYKDFYKIESNINEEDISKDFFKNEKINVKSAFNFKNSFTDEKDISLLNSNQDFNVNIANNNRSILLKEPTINTRTTDSPKKRVNFKESNGVHNALQHVEIPINEMKLLKLTIVESKYNQVGDVLQINNFGLLGSTRNTNDGIVIFGKIKANNNVDYVLQQEDGINDRQFEIKFENKLNGYYLKNNKNSGVFIKIDKPMIIKDGMIVSFGTNHIHVTIVNKDINDQKDGPSVIKLKVIYGPNKNQEQ